MAATIAALTKTVEAGGGDAETRKSLGDAYAASKKYGDALDWYTRAAEAGSAEGAHELSLMYAHGRGTTQDKGAAKKWQVLAAERGCVRAQLFVASLYLSLIHI